MHIEIISEGERVSVAFLCDGDRCETREFIEELSRPDQRKVFNLLTRFSNIGRIHNEQKFKKLTNTKIFEFKPTSQVRLLSFWGRQGDQAIVVAFGVVKKKGSLRMRDIERAEALRQSYLGGD